MSRKKLIAGNWKMNKTPSEAKAFATDVAPKLNMYADKVDISLCVPYVSIGKMLWLMKDLNVSVGAQNVHSEDSGEFTGEVSAAMLKDAGVEYVIIGHSERRAQFRETDETVNKKTCKALEHVLTPIVCVGESAAERESGVTADVIKRQVTGAFALIPADAAVRVVIAYEPIWAIGKNALRPATDDEAQEACKMVRNVVRELYNNEVAEKVRVLYGGSVNAGNAKNLFALPDVDGGLVGGASLKPDFEEIVKAAV